MAIINGRFNQVVAWSGEVEGPFTVFTESHRATTAHRYIARLGVGGAELKQVSVIVTDEVKMILGRPDLRVTEDLVKKCIARFIENHYSENLSSAEDEEFRLGAERVEQLRDQVLSLT